VGKSGHVDASTTRHRANMHVERVDDVVFPSLAPPSYKPISQPACAHPVFPVTLHGGTRRRGVIETVRRQGSESADRCVGVSIRQLEAPGE
jgi:hypothetical protein